MRLMRPAEAPASAREFRYSRRRALAAVVAVLAAVAALVVLGQTRAEPGFYFVAAGLGLMFALYGRMVTARFRPSNWLARMAVDGLYLQFRSYLNHHYAGTEPSVVFIPYREIRWARLVSETRKTARTTDGTRRTYTQRRRLVELELDTDVAMLARAVEAESAGRGASLRFHHRPVWTVGTRGVKIEWSVAPDAARFLEQLRSHASIEPPLQATEDFTRLQAAPAAEQEARLRELATSGQVIAAVEAARELYGLDLAEARRFIRDLQEKGKGG